MEMKTGTRNLPSTTMLYKNCILDRVNLTK
nr:MAG TPA: hypothetical protein [Caudoviricetes sp.]